MADAPALIGLASIRRDQQLESDIFNQFGVWIALNLSRGPDAPLSENDVTLLTEEMGVKS